ncbi:MAG: sensor histidine kinase [Anaerolineae bacterium]|nr:sensor histidine kinase [Anaerolineae bacterium]NUQ06747.1 sensor histidine kinase [Anaerolineae bacterium]
MFRLKSLRQKLIASFLLLTLLPITATSLYGLFFTRAALSDQALERSTYQVDLQVESIAGALRQVQNDVEVIHALRSLNMLRQQTTAQGVELWEREVAGDLLVLASVRPMYHAVRLFDDEGAEIAGVEADEDTIDIVSGSVSQPDDSYIHETLRLNDGEVYLSPFHHSPESDAPYIHYAARLPDGVLVLDLHAGWLLRALPQRPGADTWALIDQDGRFWVYPEGFDPQSIAEDVPHLLTGAAGRYETTSSVYVFDVIHSSNEALSPAAAVEAGAPERYWVIFRLTPTAVLYADLHNFYRLALIFVVGSALVAVWLAVGTGQWLVAPVRRLQTMAIQYGRSGALMSPPPHLPDDEIGALTRTFVDLTHELENKRRREHRLLENLINAQEEERKLLAYDLHDGLIQQMVGARFYLTNCRDVCPIPETPVRGSIQRGCDALTQAIVEGRRIIEGLRPAVLDDLGLRSAIEETAQKAAAAAGWELTLDLQKLPTEPDKTIAVTLFRIAQEALNNVRKHAHAGQVRVSLHNGEGIFLSISDDGIGFDPDSISREGRGVGITAMQERASLIQGGCRIRSARGSGTTIEVHIPQKAVESLGAAMAEAAEVKGSAKHG